jgi:hypothetical protein
MVAAGPTVLREYGAYVADRLGSFDNLVWVQAGDYDVPDKRLVDAIADGIADVNPHAIQTAHTARGHLASDEWADRPWLTLDNIYAADDIYSWALTAHQRSGRPYFLIEGWYENEHGASTQLLRNQAYGAVLGGATGHVFGSNPVWHFGRYAVAAGAPGRWEEGLGSAGSRSMEVLERTLAPLPWWKLEPDVSGSFVTNGIGSRASRAQAAVASDGSLGMVYVPTDRRLTIDVEPLRRGDLTFSWIDPTTGAVTPACPTVTRFRRRHAVHPPKRNADGDADWLLLVESA